MSLIAFHDQDIESNLISQGHLSIPMRRTGVVTGIIQPQRRDLEFGGGTLVAKYESAGIGIYNARPTRLATIL